MNKTNPKVDFYFNKSKQWKQEMEQLRAIVLDCNLTEQLKWGVPCYTLENNNVLLIHEFKEYCAILFFKGALMTDAESILIQQTENTQSSRQIRFTSSEQITEMEGLIKTYIEEAIEVEKSGLKVEFKKSSDFPLPQELQAKFQEMPDFKEAFEALTPGRQRAYLLHFSAAKQSKTREARIEKSMSPIFEGKGLND